MKSIFIIILVIVVAAAALVGYKVYNRSQLRESFGRGGEPDRSGTGAGEIPQGGGDLCNGTGGTGQIVSVGNNAFTLQRNDGKSEIVNLTGRSTIKTSTGSASASDLKTGDKVTVIIDGSETATTVLICNSPDQETRLN